MRPTTPEVIKDRLAFYAQGKNTLQSPGMRGLIIGTLNKICGGDDERHLLLFALFGNPSSKNLTPQQWYGLMMWVDPAINGGHEGEIIVTREVRDILNGLPGYAKSEDQLKMELGF